jgi:arsenite methyltransferase
VAQLEFNEQLAEQMEVVYRSADVRRRRRLVYDLLAAQPGDRVLDAGCGPGFYVAELLDQVGPSGFVAGVDGSPSMLAVAAHRVEGRPNVELHESDVTALPAPDAAFDRVLSVQVLEYVEDVDRGLRELHRVLRPGGRVVVWDVDWATLSWHSEQPERMERMLRAWDRHLSEPSLPPTLAPRLRRAGFEDVVMEGHAFAAAEFSPDSYGAALVPLIEDYLATIEDPEDAAAWAVEQRELGERGEFYVAVTQFGFAATRPG